MLKKTIITGVFVLSSVLPSFSSITADRAVELAKEKGIEIRVATDNHDVNAYADADDEITFLQGLLDIPTLTENKFLLVLQHEKAHVKFKHVNQKVQLGTVLNAAYDVVFNDKKIAPDIAQQILSSLEQLLNSQSRAAEIEADNEAFRVLKEEGVSIEACDLFTDVIKDAEGSEFSPFDTHPLSIDRFKACRKVLGETK